MTAGLDVDPRQLRRDPQLCGSAFAPLSSWAAWDAFEAAIHGQPMTGAELAIYRECTGREASPSGPMREVWCSCGRRAGKSREAALLAVHRALFHRHNLAPGEVGTVQLIAADRAQARVLMGYVKALLHGSPLLESQIERETVTTIDLSNRTRIEITTASYKTTRGYTVLCAVADEAAFWNDADSSSNPAEEVIAALRPAMATVPDSLLLVISSPYARRGPLWQAYQRLWGKDVPGALFWSAPTRRMNPSVPQSIIDQALQDDEPRARAEWLAQFRADVEGYLTREMVMPCVVEGRRELPPRADVSYVAFTDAAGGSGSDSFTLAIGHREQEAVILDVLRERTPPFSPDGVVSEFAALLKTYRVSKVFGDAYAGSWPRERFSQHGITYEVCPKPRTALYQGLLPSINSGLIELLDHPKAIGQLTSLERRVARSGRETIDHGPSGHDDLCTVIAGLNHVAEQRHAPLELFEIGPWPGTPAADGGISDRGWMTFSFPKRF